MKYEKTVLFYFSATHTTQKVARAIGKGLGVPVEEYDFTLPSNRIAAPYLDSDTMLVVGIPVYSGRIPSFTLTYLDKLKGKDTPCVLLAVYGNRHYDDALVELEDLLTDRGFLPIAAGAFIGEHSFTSEIATNRPNCNDLAEAERFGQSVAIKLADTDKPILAKGFIPGNRPYKEVSVQSPIIPIINSKCNNCGICIANCPMGAIDPNHNQGIDPMKCIKCRSCARVCPNKAIDIVDPIFQNMVQNCITRFGFPERSNEVVL